MKYFLILVSLALNISLNAQTLTWSAEFPVTGGNNYNNIRPRIALTTDNTPIVMWGDDVNSIVYTAKWNGSGFTAPLKIHSDSVEIFTSYWAGPEFEASGDMVFIGLKVLPEAENGVYSVRSTDGGLTFEDTVRIDNIGDSLARYPTVTIGANGNPVFAYMKFDSNWGNAEYTVVQSIDGGDTFEQDVEAGLLVTGDACDCCPAAVKTDGQRQVLVFRNNDNNLREVWMVYSDDDGASFIGSGAVDTTNWVLFSCPSTGPDFIIAGNTIHSTWMSSGGGGGSKIYVGSYDINSMQITFHSKISSVLPVANFQNYPRIDGEADLLGVVFEHTDFGNVDVLFASSLTGSAGLVDNFDTVNISTAGIQKSPDIAYSDGTFHIVWRDEVSGDVMYRNVSVPYTDIEKADKPAFEVHVNPNPFTGYTTIHFANPDHQTFNLKVFDLVGRLHLHYKNISSESVIVKGYLLTSGTYIYQLFGETSVASGKLMVR